MPTIASQLIPQLVDKSSVREKDKTTKAEQASEYNRRHGLQSLPDVEPGTRVLVHDQIGGEWNVPVIVDSEIQPTKIILCGD